MYCSFSQEVSVPVHTLCTCFGLGNKYVLCDNHILPFHFSITMEDLFGPIMGYEMEYSVLSINRLLYLYCMLLNSATL